jgi:hypothetical protein
LISFRRNFAHFHRHISIISPLVFLAVPMQPLNSQLAQQTSQNLLVHQAK